MKLTGRVMAMPWMFQVMLHRPHHEENTEQSHMQDQDEVFTTPCFQQCPSKKRAAARAEQCGGVEALEETAVPVSIKTA